MSVEKPSDADREQASQRNIEKMWKYAEKFAEKSGTSLHPQREITEAVVLRLASHVDCYGRPLCPCNIYPQKRPPSHGMRNAHS